MGLKWISKNDAAILKQWHTPTATGQIDITTELQDLSETWINEGHNSSVILCGHVLNDILRRHNL